MQSKQKHELLRETVGALVSKLGLLEETELSCCGVTLAQCHTLLEIGRAGSASLGELSARLNLDNSTMSRTVNNLVNSGLCGREEDPQDRRFVSISLTQSGDVLFHRIETGMGEWYRAIFDALPTGKRDQVLESMALLLEAVAKSGCCCE